MAFTSAKNTDCVSKQIVYRTIWP